MKSGQRLDYIDLLRGWAVIVMIETHVVNATLSAETMAGTFFPYLRFINGLVAPSFLFASGLAFAVTAQRKFQDYLTFGKPLFKQLGRILMIMGIGYTLHIPIFSLKRLLGDTTESQWQSFFQVDILQCIAASLLLLQCLLVLLRNERTLYRSVGILAAGIVLCTPLMWSSDFWEIMPWPLAAYLNGLRFSLFPLFPWGAFLFAGAMIGRATTSTTGPDARVSEERTRSMQSLLWIGGSSILLSIALAPVADKIFPPHEYWRASPSFFLLRLGIVILLCWLMYVSTLGRKTGLRSVITLFGRESLLVYVLHLLLIYGDFGGFNVRKQINESFGYLEAGLATLALYLMMYGVALGWSRIKAESRRTQVALNILTLVVVLGLFVFGEGK
jgi:uncharacterized membrane protein